jgi:hypothetical protein
MSGFRAFAISFTGIAVLAGIAYWLERNKRQLSGAIDEAFGPGGYALPYLRKDRPAILGDRSQVVSVYTNPTKKV